MAARVLLTIAKSLSPTTGVWQDSPQVRWKELEQAVGSPLGGPRDRPSGPQIVLRYRTAARRFSGSSYEGVGAQIQCRKALAATNRTTSTDSCQAQEPRATGSLPQTGAEVPLLYTANRLDPCQICGYSAGNSRWGGDQMSAEASRWRTSSSQSFRGRCRTGLTICSLRFRAFCAPPHGDKQ